MRFSKEELTHFQKWYEVGIVEDPAFFNKSDLRLYQKLMRLIYQPPNKKLQTDAQAWECKVCGAQAGIKFDKCHICKTHR